MRTISIFLQSIYIHNTSLGNSLLAPLHPRTLHLDPLPVPPNLPQLRQTRSTKRGPEERRKRNTGLDRRTERRARARAANQLGQRDPAREPEDGVDDVEAQDGELVRPVAGARGGGPAGDEDEWGRRSGRRG